MDREAPDSARIADVVRTEFDKKRILVVGDLMLDRYLWGEVGRISPEAPVPVLRHGCDATRAGGAGNVALNLAGFGVDVSIAGFVGPDEAGKRLLEILTDAGIDTRSVKTPADRSTITKTRIMAGHQHVLRVDSEHLDTIAPPSMADLLSDVKQQLETGPDAIILSDYAKGALGQDVCRKLIESAHKSGAAVFVDPKGRDFARYAGANAITPNLSELELATGVEARDIDALIEAGREMVRNLCLGCMILTRGGDGMTLIASDETLHRPAVTREVFDVSGAGDTVIASLAAGFVAGLDWNDLLHMANVAASIVVGKVGPAAVERAVLLHELHTRSHTLMGSVYSIDEMKTLVSEWRSHGETIVFTNGCFDIVHAGHVTYLHTAARQGDRLIVAVNTDRSVRALKGETRPVTGQVDRACVVSSLAAVDAVVFFDEATPLNVVNALRPDVLVKGGDYDKSEIVGATEVESWGGRVVLVPLVEGRSTSNVIRKITG